MIWASLLLLVVGMALSAFFSGSETGFYRIPRVRLLIDALAGNWLARALMWITNRPSLFVATTLVGNNLANYMTSAALVIATGYLFRGSFLAELAAPIVLAPVLFVYGESLPKHLFYQAPNKLLRACGPLLFFFTLVFLPISGVLWGLSKFLELIAGESPQRLQRRLARRELVEVLEEGHILGILHPSQKLLAQGIFAIEKRPVTEFTTPLSEAECVHVTDDKSAILRIAQQHDLDYVLVVSPDTGRSVGYLRVAELYLDRSGKPLDPNPLLTISSDATHLAALMKMQTAGEPLARVVDRKNNTESVVTLEQLSEPIFQGGIAGQAD